jgi:hypothetical protein
MGYFKFYRTVDDMLADKDCLGEYRNKFVDSGKLYALDRIWRIADWHASGSDTIYMRVGNSTNTNADVVGPTPSTPVVINGAWQGVDPSDWKLSNELTDVSPAAVQIIRSGKTVHMYATFTTSGTDKDVFEIGIFLGNGGGVVPRYPLANPATGGTNDDKQNAMICRAVNYYGDSGNYYTSTQTITTTEGWVARYIFDDFEG